MTPYLSYFFAFVVYTLVLAGKDFLYRFLMLKSVPIASVLGLSGATCLAVGLIVAAFSHERLIPKTFRYQLVRFVISGAVWWLAAKSFQSLSATSVAVVSKAYIPLLVLIGPLLGNHFLPIQKQVSWLSLFLMVGFALWLRPSDELLIGYLYLTIAIVLMMAEYILLRKTTKEESPFVVAAAPALSCVALGVYGWPTDTAVAVNEWGWMVFGGILMYLIYFASIYRYRILPLGLAEYPALITAIIILPFEMFIFGHIPSLAYVMVLAILVVLLGLCVRLNLKGK